MTTDHVRLPGRSHGATISLARLCWAAVLLVLIAAAPAAAQVLDGPPFPIATDALGTMDRVTAATRADGTIMTLLELQATRTQLRARAYSAVGAPLGPESRIDTGGNTLLSSIAALPGGGYVTTWRVLSRFANADPVPFIARFLDTAGGPVATEEAIDDRAVYPTGAAAGLAGRTAFVWVDGDQIIGKIRFSNGSLPIDFAVSSRGVVNDVLALPDGGFAVLWTGVPSAEAGLLRLFDPDGSPRGAAIRASEYLGGPNQLGVTHLAVDGIGQLVAVGVRTGAANRIDVYARRFDPTGAPLGNAFLVHESDAGERVEPDVACDRVGNCLVAWSKPSSGITPDTPVRIRAYDASGSAVGPMMVVANGPALGARVEHLTGSRFVVTWHDGAQATGAIVSLCTPGAATCGDGTVVSVCEECDAGAANSDVVPDMCRSDCRLAYCGDGVVDSTEGCDDGNTTSCDGCNDRCQPEIGTGCGDGLREPTCELCDDGNTVAGDGCSSSCKLERIPGGGSLRTDCLTEWLVTNPSNVPLYDARGVINRNQKCVDDDPRCDFDGGTPGSCTFAVQVCANNTGVPKCPRPERLRSWSLVSPSAALAASRPALAAARAAFQPVPQDLLGPSVPDVCSEMLMVPVPLRGSPGAFASGTLKLKTRATDYANATDGDTLKLVCRPAP